MGAKLGETDQQAEVNNRARGKELTSSFNPSSGKRGEGEGKIILG